MGACPSCGHLIYTYTIGRGKNRTVVWVVDEPSVRALLARLEEKIRTLPDLSEFKFEGDVMPELGMAKTLLSKCGGNQELALLVIDQFFKRREIWIKPRSFAQVLWNKPSRSGNIGLFSIAMAYAREEYNARPKSYIEAGKLPDLE
jgi:hypothetical protein